MPDSWLPRTPLERLIVIDTTLAGIVPRITAARQRIIDLLPGHSGRPAGTGDPGGGHGATNTTIVERTALTNSDEWVALTRIDNLVEQILATIQHRADWRGGPPLGATHARRLAWSRWLLRRLIDRNTRLRSITLERLWNDVDELDRLVDTWAAPRPGGRRSRELAADPTDTWCRSCLRAGHRNPRDPRYTTDGLCRWCGDFQAEQGRLPSLDIVDAHETGSSVAVARLIRDQKQAPTKRRTKRRKR